MREAVDQVQEFVIRGSPCDEVCHFVIRFASAQSARLLLRHLLDHELTWYRGGPRARARPAVSLGLTYVGLETLDVPRSYLSIFRALSRPFTDGAPIRAARYLGDTGPSEPSKWDREFALRNFHAMVTVHGNGDEFRSSVERIGKLVRGRLQTAGEVFEPLFGKHLPPPPDLQHSPVDERARWVHFGYRDNLAKPTILPSDANGGTRDLHAPGELLLGRVTNVGDNPWSLTHLDHEVRNFFLLGSFGVLRRIEQDARAFEAAVERWARQLCSQKIVSLADNLGHDIPSRVWAAKQFVKAKLCGRWPNGRVVRPTDALMDEPEFEGDPVAVRTGEAAPLFDGDAYGHGCPFQSHIRRMNPRNTAQIQPRPRVLFRRGVPYGGWLGAGLDAGEDDQARGLLGVFFCSDLENQFEHLLGRWANRRPLGGTGDLRAKDPLIGNHESPSAGFTVSFAAHERTDPGHRAARPAVLQGFGPFAHTRGTAYCFFPSRTALMQIIEENWKAEKTPW